MGNEPQDGGRASKRPAAITSSCRPCRRLPSSSPPFSSAFASAGFASPAGAAPAAATSPSAATVSSVSATAFGTTAVAIDRITGALRHDGHARGQLHAGHVQRMRGVELGQIDLDELGQVLRQARDIDLGHHVADDRALALDGRRQRLVDEVQRHLHVDLARRIDPLEVDVQHLVAERVHLHVAQQHLRARAVDLHRQDRRVEDLVAQRMDQRVVVELDRLRRASCRHRRCRAPCRCGACGATRRDLRWCGGMR